MSQHKKFEINIEGVDSKGSSEPGFTRHKPKRLDLFGVDKTATNEPQLPRDKRSVDPKDKTSKTLQAPGAPTQKSRSLPPPENPDTDEDIFSSILKPLSLTDHPRFFDFSALEAA